MHLTDDSLIKSKTPLIILNLLKIPFDYKRIELDNNMHKSQKVTNKTKKNIHKKNLGFVSCFCGCVRECLYIIYSSY